MHTKDNSEFGGLLQKQKKKKRIIILISIAAVLLVSVTLFYLLDGYSWVLRVLNVDTVATVEPKCSSINYIPYGTMCFGAGDDTVFIYDSNGVTAFDSEGNWLWNTSCYFKSPKMYSYKDCVVLADSGGVNVYCFDKSGLKWRFSVDNNIFYVGQSRDGKDFLLVHDSPESRSAFSLYRVGDKGCNNVFTRKYSTYSMISADISASGDQIAVSGAYVEGSSLYSVVTYLRVKDGEVYTTEQFDGELYPVCCYIGDNLFLANSDSVKIMHRSSSSAVDKDFCRDIWDRNANSNMLACTAVIGRKFFAGVFCPEVTEDSSMSFVSDVVLYDASGKEKASFETEGIVQGILGGEDNLALYTENEIRMYDTKGNLIGEYKDEAGIKAPAYVNEKILVYYNGETINILNYVGESKD